MDATGIAYLGIALAAVAAAIAGFFALFGKGPRGSVLTVAACLFTWGAVLPVALCDPDSGTVSRELDLLATVLMLSGLAGAILGVFDLFQQRPASQGSVVEWILRQPFIWGGAVSVAFYEALSLGAIDSPLLVRYLAGHPVEYAEGVLFFVGLAALAIRYVTVTLQLRSLRHFSLAPISAGQSLIADCDYLLSQLAELPASLQQGYLGSRLRDAIEHVRRKNSADSLDNHLRHLEELDLSRMHAGYAVVRIAIWAVPILGFLGTVIGITMAIASLSPQALEQSMPEVTAGLGVAFDTTAEALALSLILVFGKSWVERVENRLLEAVDSRVSAELVGRFQDLDMDSDPNVAAIRRMAEQVLVGVETLASRQAEVWRSTIDETHRQWAEVSLTAGKIIKDSLSSALTDTLDRHASVLGENLGRQTQVLKEEISRQTDRLSASTAQHAECLSASTAQHAERLSTSATRHADKLDDSAQQTAARLHDGLEKLAELLVEALHEHGEVLTDSEKGLAEENRRHMAEVEAALGEAMVVAADRQERLIRQSEILLREMQAALALARAAGQKPASQAA